MKWERWIAVAGSDEDERGADPHPEWAMPEHALIVLVIGRAASAVARIVVASVAGYLGIWTPDHVAVPHNWQRPATTDNPAVDTTTFEKG